MAVGRPAAARHHRLDARLRRRPYGAWAGREPGRSGVVRPLDRGNPVRLTLSKVPPQRFRLTPHITGSDVLAALDALLSRWRDHLATVPETAGADTAAVVCWPSRDVAGVRALVAHGLVPHGVIAAWSASPAACGNRGLPAWCADQAGNPGGPRCRHADDVWRYSGSMPISAALIERPGAAETLRAPLAGLLGADDPWTWLAERDGVPVGLLVSRATGGRGLDRPADMPSRPWPTCWRCSSRPPSTGQASVQLSPSNCTAAPQLTRVSVILLEYEQVNPLSVPFWGGPGYRPLWTTWETRPALMLR